MQTRCNGFELIEGNLTCYLSVNRSSASLDVASSQCQPAVSAPLVPCSVRGGGEASMHFLVHACALDHICTADNARLLGQRKRLETRGSVLMAAAYVSNLQLSIASCLRRSSCLSNMEKRRQAQKRVHLIYASEPPFSTGMMLDLCLLLADRVITSTHFVEM